MSRTIEHCQESSPKSSELEHDPWSLTFPNDPQWAHVLPYYIPPKDSDTTTYMVKDSGGVPEPHWVKYVIDEDCLFIEVWTPRSITLSIAIGSRPDIDPPDSLTATAKDLAPLCGRTVHSFSMRGGTLIAFLWLLCYDVANITSVGKTFANQPRVVYVDVESTRLRLASNDD